MSRVSIELGSSDMKIQTSWLLRQHMKQILDIEQDCFAFPWRLEDFESALKCRNCIGMVAQDEQKRVQSYCVYQLEKHEINILSIAVRPHAWRLGVGTRILDRLKNKLIDQRRTDITATVRETNQAALLFFSANGFWAERLLRDHYELSPEDGIAMRYSLDGRPAVYWGGRLSAYRPPVAEASCDVDE